MVVKLEPDKIYRIIMQASNKEILFDSDEAYQIFLKKYAEMLLPVVDTYAYCLTPDTAQWVVKIKSEEELFVYLKSASRIPEETMNLKNYQALSEATTSLAENFFSLQLKKQFNVFQHECGKVLSQMKSAKIRTLVLNSVNKEIESSEMLKMEIIFLHNHPVSCGLGKEIENWKYSSYPAYLMDKPSAVKRDSILALFEGRANFIQAHMNQSANTTASLN